MFRQNRRSQQALLLSDVNVLPERSLRRLQESWAATFRQELFERIDEGRYAVLYSEKASRPNVPVNVLVGLEILKVWRHWTDEEMYEHFLFDLQVRHALGCDRFGEHDFEIRTVYYFRARVAAYALQTGNNLLQGTLEQVSDAQMAKMGLRSDLQRLDSVMLLSNIADLSRLELLIRVLQRLWRILKEGDRERYLAVFEPYVKESAGQYTYRLKGREVVWEHIGRVGQVLQGLLGELKAGYGAAPVYGVAERFFAENFVLEGPAVRAKHNDEIGPGCLQSLDDLEASYRRKGNRSYKGYVANVAETCHPANPVQLITQVQVAPNQTNDIELLEAGISSLKARTNLEMIVTDGAYVSPAVDQVLREHQVKQITTGLTGTLPDHTDGRLALSDFELQLDDHGAVTQAICPAGYQAEIQPAASGKSDYLRFASALCRACPFFAKGQCPAEPKASGFGLRLPRDRAQSSQRRRLFERYKEEARNLRTAVEATIFQVKHKWVKGKLRVRGLFRVTSVVICSALAVNLRRIDRYHKQKLRGKLSAKPAKQPGRVREALAVT